MSLLDQMVENHDELVWTEKELADWIRNLPDAKRMIVLDTLTEAKRRGLNLHRFGCNVRRRAELHEQRNQPAWYDLWSEISIGWMIGGLITGTKKLC